MDFLIVGGGAVGLASAQSLLQAGHRVTIIERGVVGQEASWAGGGILSPLCPWDYRECVTQLALRGMGMFREAADLLYKATGIETEYQRSGMLVLPPIQQERVQQWCARHEFEAHPVSITDYLPAQSNKKYPGEGLLLPEVSQVRNPYLLSALKAHVEMLGGIILEQHDAQSFDSNGEQITGLQTTHGRITADGYIVAAGAWSKVLLGEHSLNMDIRPILGQILLFKFDTPPFRQILLKENLYFIPRRDGHVLVGSTLEDVGFNKHITVEARENLLEQVHEIFPEWKNQLPIKHWAGLRPGSPENIPTIGRHPQLMNLYVNSGHFRYGVTMSLSSAEVLLNEIEGKTQPFSTDEYRWQ